MRARISSQIRKISQGVLAGAGWNEGGEKKGKDFKKGCPGSAEKTGSERPRPSQSLLTTRPPVKWVAFVLATKSLHLCSCLWTH